MPIYLHECATCGVMELERPMSARAPTRCPQCKRKGLQRIYQCYFKAPCDMFHENLNGGMGEYYPQYGKKYLDPYTKTTLNPVAHHRSRADALEYAKRQEWSVDKC